VEKNPIKIIKQMKLLQKYKSQRIRTHKKCGF